MVASLFSCATLGVSRETAAYQSAPLLGGYTPPSSPPRSPGDTRYFGFVAFSGFSVFAVFSVSACFTSGERL
jgi:hypothetical protein